MGRCHCTCNVDGMDGTEGGAGVSAGVSKNSDATLSASVVVAMEGDEAGANLDHKCVSQYSCQDGKGEVIATVRMRQRTAMRSNTMPLRKRCRDSMQHDRHRREIYSGGCFCFFWAVSWSGFAALVTVVDVVDVVDAGS